MADDIEGKPKLHCFMTNGEQWAIVCECGWQIVGTGDTEQRDAEALAHRCPPPDGTSRP